MSYQKIIREGLRFYETKIKKRKTFQFLDEYEKNQWKSPEEIKEIQWFRLKSLLNFAYENVPFYLDRFRANGVTPSDIRSPGDLVKLPPLTKKDIKTNYERLISRNVERSGLYKSRTGGSTGDPIQFEYGRSTYERRMAAQYRSNAWAGCNIGDKELHLWALDAPASWLKKLKIGAHRKLLRQKVMDCFAMSQEEPSKILESYNSYRPKVIIGYASALYAFAAMASLKDSSPHSPESIITTAEMLYPDQKEVVEKVFNAPVFSRYGSREVMLIAAECPLRKGLHINSDNIVLELMNDQGPALHGEMGEIYVTDLNNYEMPLIRYQIGDTGMSASRSCECGRGLPLLEQITGRTYDLIITGNGGSLAGVLFNRIMRKYEEIRQFQIVQESINLIRIMLVLWNPMSPFRLNVLKSDLKKLLPGDVRFEFEFCKEIPLEKSGKRRVTISKVR